MIRYRYNRQHEPPAPFIFVSLRGPQGKEVARLPGQLDTAADWTVVPQWVVRELGLIAMDEVVLMGFGGQVVTRPTYALEIQIHDLARLEVEVTSDDAEPFVLLGRDVLNRYRIVLDGPGLAFEIE